ncbi:helix-turn-helix domain-containing protein, partial [Blautia massiliensis (ex Durand et al. 2017)]|uniref:helix-turn-helix domain-containing protein n=1 Tax=Blautia massiliensis (ex Durand et al. 2017) TaxID=1737424 RepID=UPI003566C619
MFSAQLSSQITVLLFGYQLSPDEKNLLRTYFSLEMSLADAAEKLFLHKNTFQYKLNHIYKKCGQTVDKLGVGCYTQHHFSFKTSFLFI